MNVVGPQTVTHITIERRDGETTLRTFLRFDGETPDEVAAAVVAEAKERAIDLSTATVRVDGSDVDPYIARLADL